MVAGGGHSQGLNTFMAGSRRLEDGYTYILIFSMYFTKFKLLIVNAATVSLTFCHFVSPWPDLPQLV